MRTAPRHSLLVLAAASWIGAVAISATASAVAPPASPKGSLYQAAIAAASASLRLHDTAEARRWLEAAPVAERGWEWRYLNARSDESQASIRAHEPSISGVAVAPDGKLVATASSDRTVRLWQAESLAPVRTLAAHQGPVWTVRFSPDGERLLSASSDGTARLFEVGSGVELRKLEEIGSGIAAADFSPDGRLIATCSWKRSAERGVWGLVTIFDASTGARLRTIEHGVKPIVTLAWSPDGSRLAVGTWDADVAIWGRESWELLHRLVPPVSDAYQAVQSIAWSADGGRLAVGAKDGTARVWSLPAARVEHTFFGQAEGQRSWVNGLAYLPGGELLAAQADGTLRAFAADGHAHSAWHGHTGALQAVTVSPATRTLFTAGGDGELRRWELDRLTSGRTTWRPGNDAYEVAWSPDGRRAALTGWGGAVEIRDTATGRIVHSWSGHEQSGVGVAWSRDGERLATTGNDGRVRLWMHDGTPVATLENGAGRQLTSVAFSPDSRHVAAPTSVGTVRVWRAHDGALETTMEEPGRTVSQVAWSPDGAWLATTARDGRVVFWELATRRQAGSVERSAGSTVVDYSPDGRSYAIGSSDGTIATYHERQQGSENARFAGHKGPVLAVRHSPDGQRLASAGGDQTVRIWNALSGDLLLTLPFDAAVYNLAWSPDGSTLAATPLNATVVLLESAP